MRYLVILFLAVTLQACSSLADKNKIVGKGADGIISQDIDSDNKGSDSGGIEGLNTIYFDYDSSGLSEDAKGLLEENINWIKNNSSVTSIELEGHCDAMGSEAYNIGLGRRRAQTVKSFLEEKGISSNQLSIISYGEERPFSEVDNSKNRRVNFVPIY